MIKNHSKTPLRIKINVKQDIKGIYVHPDLFIYMLDWIFNKKLKMV